MVRLEGFGFFLAVLKLAFGDGSLGLKTAGLRIHQQPTLGHLAVRRTQGLIAVSRFQRDHCDRFCLGQSRLRFAQCDRHSRDPLGVRVLEFPQVVFNIEGTIRH
jgi:hypothetical protein